MHERVEAPEYQYLSLLQELLDHGDQRMDRTGVGTLALFGREMRFDLRDGFPAFTTKRVFWKTAFKEMLWMLSGGTNIRELLEQNVHIWTDWPLARYRRATGEEVTQEEFEARILGDREFADKWGDLARSTESSGVGGSRRTDARSIRYKTSSTRSGAIQPAGVSSGMDGTSENWTRWRCLLATNITNSL